MKLSLVVLSEGKARGQAIPITLPQFLIGRDPQCQMRPASPLISKRHCALLMKNGKAFVRDFGSTNGTFVNDEPVKGERQLQADDTLKVGPLLFRVALEASTPVNKPTPPPPKASEPTDDDSVAAMLLSLQDDVPPATAGPSDADGVPTGSTVHEIIAPLTSEAPEGEARENAGQEGEAREGAKEAAAKPTEKKEQAKKELGDTSKAAAAILEKYTRRQRS